MTLGFPKPPPLPPGSFLAEYLNYTQHQASPEVFHFWVGISILGAILERRVWVDQGFYRVYPNFYILLVSESAVGKKTTAISIGVESFLRPLRDANNAPQAYIIMDKLTPEFVYKAISEEGHSTMVRHPGRLTITKDGLKLSRPAYLTTGELKMMLSPGAIANGILDIFIHLYTCPPVSEYNTKTGGNFFVYSPCLNILSGVTPEGLGDLIDRKKYAEGIVGRIVFVYSSQHREVEPRPVKNPSAKPEAARIRKLLQRVCTLRGVFKWQPLAGEAYDTWFRGRSNPSEDALRSGFWGRQPDLVISLAMALSASRGSDMEISLEDIQGAIFYADQAREDLGMVFSPASSTGGDPKVTRVEEFLQRKTTATRSQITRALYRYLDGAEVGLALSRLKTARRVRETKTRTGGFVYTLR